MSSLEFRSVRVDYGRGSGLMRAVDDVTLEVPAGQVVGLVGESGSGKSTLARSAVGLASLSSGEIWVDGRPLARQRRGPRPIQMVFQDPYSSLDPRMRVGSSIAEALPGKTRTTQAEVGRLLEMVELDPGLARHLPRQLSGGQRQRVALARALAARPKIIIADEVTSALDVSVQGAVLNLLRRINREEGVAMLFISHNLAVVRYLSDSVAVMYRGRLVEVGATERVLAEPEHRYTQTLLQAVPRFRAEPYPQREVTR